jgi:hypothetical protein
VATPRWVAVAGPSAVGLRPAPTVCSSPTWARSTSRRSVRLVKEIDAPINVVTGDRMPSVSELEEIGVARISFGTRPMRATLALIRKMAREWIETGTYATMTADTLSYAEVNAMRTASRRLPDAPSMRAPERAAMTRTVRLVAPFCHRSG